ncbi:WD40 repeat domain-containing serine/threonine-protein kinase [Candidatus Uabimicrobium amorphum]|uniref:non-specific serine/threonine protein kinase n=1 Tax=Uabimicrobium amorphum TaxID=2596890 RepID=A0A5S9F5R1_UABAM|nr:serine/threonine-protein kinase [Candidatus Uabimicrobium amorphum]BBM86888.1 protein kinase [Candidatus Uabimicrobium amorphum]
MKFRNYRLLDELGRGGMGIVYLARDEQLGRECALKVLINANTNSRQLQRFMREMRAVARLNHPCIITMFESGTEPTYFYTMEYIPGITLKEAIRQKCFSTNELIHIFIKICHAIEYAHKNNVIHRDLKPANIMVRKNNEPVVMDFGLAKQLGEQDISISTDILGTPMYMAPEILNGRNTTRKSDLYSLGTILYEILVGRPPYVGDSVMNIFYQVVHTEILPPTCLNPSIKKDLDIICLKCLNKKPQKRYSSVCELRQELQRFIDNKPILTKSTGTWARIQKWIYRHPLPSTIMVISVLSTAIISLLLIAVSQKNNELAQQRQTLEKSNHRLAQNQEELKANNILLKRSLAKASLKHAYTHIGNKEYPQAAQELVYARKILKKHDKTNELREEVEFVLTNAIYSNLPICLGEVELPIAEFDMADFTGRILTKELSTTKIWDVSQMESSPRLLYTIPSSVKLARISANGRFVTRVNPLNQIEIYDVRSQQKKSVLPGKYPGISHIKISDSGQQVLFIAKDRLWFWEKGKKIRKLALDKKERVHNIALAANGKYFAASSGGVVFIFKNGKKVRDDYIPINHHSEAMSLNPRRNIIVYTSNRGEFVISNFNEDYRVSYEAHSGKMADIAFSRRGHFFATAGEDGRVILWNAANSKKLFVLPTTMGVQQVCFDNSGRFLYVCGTRQRKIFCQKWQIHFEKATQQFTLSAKEQQQLNRIVNLSVNTNFNTETATISPKNRYYAFNLKIRVVVVDRQNPNTTKSIFNKNYQKISSLWFDNDETKMLVHEGPSITIYDLPDLTNREMKIKVHDQRMSKFSPDGRFLYVSRDKGYSCMEVYSTASGQKIAERRTLSLIREIAFDPQRKWVALGARRGIIEIWPANFWDNPNKEEYSLVESDHYALAWDYAEKLISASADGKITAWERQNVQWLNTTSISIGLQAKEIKISPDNRFWAALTNHSIVIYDLSLNKHVKSYLGYNEDGSANISKDWQYIALPSILGEFSLRKFHHKDPLIPQQIQDALHRNSVK